MNAKKIYSLGAAILILTIACFFTGGDLSFLHSRNDQKVNDQPFFAAEDPTLVYYTNFFYPPTGGVPTGWTSNNGGNLRFYVIPNGYCAFATDCLYVSDSLAGSYVYGYEIFDSSVATGTLEFEFVFPKTPESYGSTLKEYHIIMRDATGTMNIFNITLYYIISLPQDITLSLEGTLGSKHYFTEQVYRVKVVFTNNLLDLYIDGTLEISGVAYGGETIQQIYIESTSEMDGDYILT